MERYLANCSSTEADADEADVFEADDRVAAFLPPRSAVFFPVAMC